MNRSRFSCLLALLGCISACSGNVELERPPTDSGAGASAGSARDGIAGASAGGARDGGAGASADAAGSASQELILNTERVEELLTDGTRLYWIDEDLQLRGCLVLSCAQSVMTYGAFGIGITESKHNRIRNFDITEQRVVWRAAGGISSCPKSGCGAEQTLLASDSIQTWWGLSASGSDVYWASDLDIYRCADTGCNSVPSALASSETTSMKLVFQGRYAYWIGVGGIRRAPRDGSEAPSTIIAGGTDTANGRGVGEIDELGIDAERLYWLGHAGHILSCPIAGCAAEDAKVLVATEDGKQDFQVDASGLYWLDDDAGGAVVHCPLAGCVAPTPVTPVGIEDFALDEASLYWAENLGHREGGCCVGGGIDIRRIAKPSP